MDVIKLVGSVVCFILAIFIGIISSVGNKKHSKRDRIDDVPRYMKRGFVNKYYGNHENSYTNIDDAQFHYSLDRMKNEMKGGVEHHAKYKNNLPIKKKSEKHSWYRFKTWDDLNKDQTEWDNYMNDRKHAREEFFFNWEKVFERIKPYIHNEKNEAIGILRTESDNKTLYVYDMESAPSMKTTESYAAGIPYHLVKKYANMPGYFLFHTHPMGINGDPLPSDADLYSCLLDCYSDRFVGHVVIGEYGAVIYFLKPDRMEQLESGGALKYFTYCYDLISAWNAICNSSGPINQSERVSFLEKWGFDMIIVPSSHYISDTYNKTFLPGVIYDRFTKTKYELLDKMKSFIKRLEIEDEKKKNKKTTVSNKTSIA